METNVKNCLWEGLKHHLAPSGLTVRPPVADNWIDEDVKHLNLHVTI